MILRCEQCRALVDGVMVGHYVVSDDIAPTFRFSLLKCPRCCAPLLAVQEEDFAGDWEAPRRLFPVEDESLGYDVPQSIRAAFDEARRCIQAGAYTASAIMCRKVAEGVCVAHGMKKGNLAASLRSLAEGGVLETRMLGWADHLRLYGNDAAHDVEIQIEQAEAEDLLDFTRALVEYVFTYRLRFEAFKERRGSRGEAGSAREGS